MLDVARIYEINSLRLFNTLITTVTICGKTNLFLAGKKMKTKSEFAIKDFVGFKRYDYSGLNFFPLIFHLIPRGN